MLKLQNVTKKYLRHTALDDVSYELEEGRTCLLLGPNGSGKTTMMKAITGLVKPTSGEITFCGDPIGPATKAQIAYMPTENYFYSYMTIRDIGRYYADFFRDFQPNRFEQMLRQMELEPGDRIRQLSSGMAAKLRLALTLSREARLMMFDEPLNGVDILTRTQVIDTIMAGRLEGRSMMISTHLVDELENVVDYVIFLKNGKVIMHGDKKQICGKNTLKDLYLQVYGNIAPTHDDARDYVMSAPQTAAPAGDAAERRILADIRAAVGEDATEEDIAALLANVRALRAQSEAAPGEPQYDAKSAYDQTADSGEEV